jgi:predicted PurR-regulated permease PerM
VSRVTSSDRTFTYRLVQTVATIAAAVILIAVLWVARAALMLIYVSAIIAMGFSPLVRTLEHRRGPGGAHRLPRVLAILVVYLSIVAALIVAGLLLVPPLIDQAGDLWLRAPELVGDLQRFLIRHHLMDHRFTLEEAVQKAPSSSGAAINTVVAALWSVLGGVFGATTILILSFYFLVEGESQLGYWIRFVPGPSRGRIVTAASRSVSKVSAWLGAQFILAGVMGTFAAIGLALFGAPYFYVLAMVAAVGETIPIVGPLAAGAVAVAVAVSVSGKLAAMVGVYFFALHQLEANILVPKIMERRVGVSPVAVIVALLIGSELWGLTGAILAIPTAAILTVVVDELMVDAAT